MSIRRDLDFEMSFFESLHRRMPKDVRVASVLAHIYTETGHIDSGLKMDRKLVRLNPKDPTAHYNLACSLCLKGRNAEAVAVLRTAISFGYKDFDWMQHDPDLSGLHEYAGFHQLLIDLKIG
ncbi:tetratricopeptide repeat protein [Coraliomargarita sp. SDUM461004]|uniref:Tetratricopeptide repeat protein n=1 Tax=Thalassobacterium sedimentorum TaxID=3041258 RepID=A0ABU1AJN3_9BACT|nr:tetratricopeptide repeat protein [Coraliomargarita sp. SDUM461004]MDQ8194917.1 tetratricopeptide repeat protein [Coraliomargarita sp. SDUM461004]